ncbi:putative Rho GTPase-activating protein 1-5 [Helianthus annuus]|nr:putative Rho GTPase-activating protein 1-5 [Helianthus annuus]
MTEVLHSPSSSSSSSLQTHEQPTLFLNQDLPEDVSRVTDDNNNLRNRGNNRDNNQLSLLALLLALFRKSFLGVNNNKNTVAEERLDLSGMEIGWPTDVRHVAHVTFDRFNGFLGLPVEFEPEVLRRAPSARCILFLIIFCLWVIVFFLVIYC